MGAAGSGSGERVFVGGSRFRVDLQPDPVRGIPKSFISGGAYGAVYRATWDGVEVAAKTLHMFRNPEMYGLHEDPPALEQVVQEFQQEMSVNCSLKHENIIGFVGVAYQKFMARDIPAWICTELAVTSLHAKIYAPDGVSHDLVPKYTRDAANGLHHMHTHGVLHRDVKPANLLIGRDGRLKLCDLGLAKSVDRASRLSGARAGTPVYSPPEKSDHDKKDIFALGCTLVEMILTEGPQDDGKPGGDRRADQARRAAERRDDLALLIMGCTAQDHTQRFKAADVLACEDLLPKDLPSSGPRRAGGHLDSGDPLADETYYWTEEAKKAAKSRDLGVMPTLAIPVPVSRTGKPALLVLSRGSIVDFCGDVIVNAANAGCRGGDGVDGEISAAGRKALDEARQALPLLDRSGKRCDIGDAKITIAGDLPSTWCIHAVGPNYSYVEHTKIAYAECDRMLRSAYIAAMRLCAEKRAEHVGFSLLSAGNSRGRRSLQAVLDIGVLAIAESIYEGLEEVHLVASTTEEVIALQQAGHSLLEAIVARRAAPA